MEDMLAVMSEKLGGEGLIREMCCGFQLLMDRERGLITLHSLRRNAPLLGLSGPNALSDEELRCMLAEGELDGDGALSQLEFCVLMFRLSQLMQQSWLCLHLPLDRTRF